MLRLLLDTLRIDPLDLSPNDSHEPLWPNVALDVERRGYRHTWPFARTARAFAFLEGLFRQTVKLFVRQLWRRSPIEHNAVHVVAFTTNQATSLQPIYDALGSGSAPRHLQLAHEHPDRTILRLMPAAYWVAIPFLPVVLWRAARERGYRGRSFRWAFDTYWRSYGLYFTYRVWVRRVRPGALVLSNDHRDLPCVLEEAARAEGVPTFYVQHASVTDRFPPLRVSYALLDGVDALEKYAHAGATDTVAFLIGMTKQDSSNVPSDPPDTINRVGVCLSNADDRRRVESLLAGLAERLRDIEIIIRPHPGFAPDQRDWSLGLCERFGCGVSGPDESPGDFLGGVHAIVAGVSAILLEAAVRDVLPICFATNPDHPDWYGFIENGLCESFDDPHDLIAYLQAARRQRPVVRERAKRYCATIGTPAEGRSGAIAASLIAGLCKNRDIQDLGFRETQRIGSLRAYQIA